MLRTPTAFDYVSAVIKYSTENFTKYNRTQLCWVNVE